MKTATLALVGIVALGASAASSVQEKPSASGVERAFGQGGQIRLDLSAGDYTINGTPDNTLRIRWRTRHSDDRVRANADVRGAKAFVRVNGPRNDFHVYIDVPQRADLDLDLTAGDLKIRGIEGNKTLSMWAGDVTIEAGSADLYKRVDASVRFGDLDARPFGVSKGGIFRSFRWTGHGKYTFHASLFAGDLKLVR
jgi:phage baseplate assembly protein gpV